MALSKDLQLPAVLNELSEVRQRWFDIGLQLKLGYSELKSIEDKYRGDHYNCLREMIAAWFQKTPSSQSSKTWLTLANALREPSLGYDELATKIEEKYCQTVTTGEKRPRPSAERESSAKRHCLEDDYTRVRLEKLLQEKDKRIDEILLAQNEKLKHFENLLIHQTAQIQSLTKDNKQLRREISHLKQRCSGFEEQIEENSERIKEHSEQFQKLNAQFHKLQSEMKKNETPQQTLNPTQSSKVDDDVIWMRRALYDVRDDWKKFGREFVVGSRFLSNVESEHGEDSKECLFLVLQEWLTQLETRGDKECTLCKLTEVLRSPYVEHYDLADTLDDTWHLGCPSRGNYEYGTYYPF